MKIEEIPFDRIFPAPQELTPQEKANREKFKKFLEYVKIRATDRYVFPPEILTVDEITVATVGNFSASVGKPKSRKTFNVSAIVAALLSGKEVLHYRAKLPDGKTKVLYIDTEQSRVHCFKVLHRILKMAGLRPTARRHRWISLCSGSSRRSNAEISSTPHWRLTTKSASLSSTASATLSTTSILPENP